MNEELSQAFENVAFLLKALEKNTYQLYETQKAANALRFLKAIEEGIKSKKTETISSQLPVVSNE